VLYCVTAIGARATEFCSGTKHTQEFLGVDPTPTLGDEFPRVQSIRNIHHVPPTTHTKCFGR